MTQRGRVGLIGAGAVGSLLAAALLRNQFELHWLVRNSQRRSQLEAGLALNLLPAPGEAEPRRETLSTAGLRFHNEVATLPDCDLLLAVKAYQLTPLLALLDGRIKRNDLVVANGLLDPLCLLGLLYGGTRLNDSGELHCSASSLLVIGRTNGEQQADAAADSWALRLAAPWLTVETESQIEARMWHKLALNCIVNPLTALLGQPNGALLPLLDSPLVSALLTELSVLLRSQQGEAQVSAAELRSDLRELVETTAANQSSMLSDLKAGRQTEVEQLNLAAAAYASTRGLDCRMIRLLGEAVLAVSALISNSSGPE